MHWLVAVGVLAGCYRPGADPACATRCNPGDTSPTACPGSLVCATDGTCRGPDDTCVDTDDGGPVDMRPDDSSTFCYGQGLLRICLPAAPTGSPAFVNTPIDTSISPMCIMVEQTGGPQLCVIAAHSISMVNVTVRGARPLVLIATGAISLSGAIDVASRRFELANTAAGSNDSTCVGTNNPLGQAGGNGGSFGGSGGRGGRSGSSPQAPVDPAVLRGGCPGANGNGNGAALGGRGGGAIYFIAGTSINVGNASINASGAGGTSAVSSAGGGGGSGGMIGFDTPAIDVSMGGQAFANGGGGAGGTTGSVAGHGEESPSYAIAGAGGASTGAAGGEGSLVSVDGAPGEAISQNGGGGGGGAGVIVIYPPSQAAAFSGATSPPVTL